MTDTTPTPNTFLSEYHNSPQYAFHLTRRENAERIRAEGIRRDAATEPDSSDIIQMLDELGCDDPFPFDRADVTYCHVDAAYVEAVSSSEDAGGLSMDDVVIVVDVTEIDAGMYLADMSIITDLIDYRYAGPDVMMHADTPEEAVERYRESITRVDGPTDIAAYEGVQNGHAELVVDGDIPTDAITVVHP